MRLIKEPAEIALMRQAAALARIGVMATLEAAAPGQSQLTIESIGTNAILEAAPQVTPRRRSTSSSTSTSGPETSLPHLITTTRRLTRPDLVIHSRQVSVDGERAELERTFALGAMDAETRRAFDAAEEAQLAAIAAIRPGVPMRDVDAAARRVIQAAGTASIRSTAPATASASRLTRRLRPLGRRRPAGGRHGRLDRARIYVPGLRGARHSDTVVVTPDGHETITDAPRGAANLTFDR